jgi:hypothetical protein
MGNLYNDALRFLQPGRAQEADQSAARHQEGLDEAGFKRQLELIQQARLTNPQEAQRLMAATSEQFAKTPVFQKALRDMSIIDTQQHKISEDQKLKNLSDAYKNFEGMPGLQKAIGRQIAEEQGYGPIDLTQTPANEKKPVVPAGGSVYEGNGQFFTAPEKTPPPKDTVVAPGNRVLRDGKWVEGGPEKPDTYTLGEGQQRYKNGELVASGPQKTAPAKNTKLGLGETLVNESTGQEIGSTNLKGEYFTPEGRFKNDFVGPPTPTDNRGLFSSEPNNATIKNPVTGQTRKEVKPLEGYFQSATPTVPTENTPKTFKDSGITAPADQQTIQEMQKAIPDVDLLKEYEQNPEEMKRSMELWKQKKLNKGNIKKAFSMMQQQARQSLGVA